MQTADFLIRVDEIAHEQPRYKVGHDGSDGLCDCIGLIKGAIRRAGGSPDGLKTTNRAARNTIRDFQRITGTGQLRPGMVVLKAKSPGDSGYALPDAYKPGGSHYNGDLTDYYHIGVVTAINPLRITHMTTPTIKIDNRLGKWAFFGTLPQVSDSGGGEKMGISATIKTPNGGSVNVRAGSGTSFALLGRIPSGSTVSVSLRGDRWSHCEGAGVNGWISNDYLVFTDGAQAGQTLSGRTISITLTEEQARAALPFLEAIEDQIVDLIGRG